MALYWGFDSFTSANHDPAGKGSNTFFDRIVKKITPKDLADQGEQLVPDFWGRYIGASGNLTDRERDYLLERGVGIFLLYNHLTSSRVKLGVADGWADAVKATKAADKIVSTDRNKIWIYANIEGVWTPSSTWLAGWMKGMYFSQYGVVCGFYCNTTNAPAFNKPLGTALATVAEDIGEDLGVIQKRCKLFIQNPSGNSGVNVVKRLVQFNPRISDAHPKGAAIWQANLHQYSVGSMGAVDVDVANENGAEGMIWP